MSSRIPDPAPLLTLQKQPSNVTCAQTCLAMAINEPVQKVIDTFGKTPMSQSDIVAALYSTGTLFNPMLFGTLIHTGWYFMSVPSLNFPRGMHEILVHYNADYGCSGFTVLDPSTLKAYSPDGSDLVTWGDLIAFVPGGALPESFCRN